jgi:hypothetical protein
MNKRNASQRKTKQEITIKHKKLTDSDIDIQVFQHWVDNLDSATKESFCSFAEETFSAIQVYLYAKFLGYNSSIVAVDLWLKEHFSKPDHLKVLLNEIEEMQEDIRKLRMDIENYAVKRDVGVARIAAMQKELRGTISQVDSFISSRDRKGLLMAGADRALRELASIFKDDPIEGPLQEASMSVWARMQFED